MESLLPPSSRPTLLLAFQLLVWWVANNIYAIHAQTILQKPHADPYLFIHLTFIQLLVGLCAATSIQSFLPPSRLRHHPHPLKSYPNPPPIFTPLLFLVAIAHLLGTTLSNASYRTIGATATLVWKLTEPLTTILLKRIVLRESTPFISFLGLQAVLLGVLLFSTNAFTLPSLSPILIANIAYPVRNVLLKSTQRSRDHPPLTLLDRFIALNTPAVLVAALVLFVKCLLRGGHFFPSLPVLINALLFNTYQLASLALLEKLDALTHSLVNTLKRFTGILVAALYTKHHLLPSQFVGLFMTVLGFPVYVFGSNMTALLAKRYQASQPRLSVMLFAAVALSALFALFFPSPDIYSLSTNARKSAEQIAFALQNNPQRDAESYVIHIDSRYRQLINPVVHNYEEAKRIDDGDNTGNFVWQYAAYFSLPDFTATSSCNQSYSECHQSEISGTSRQLVSYRPGANYFNSKRPGAFSIDIEALQSYGVIPLLIGIGVQAFFTKNGTGVDLFPGREIETSDSDVAFNKNAQLLFSLLNSKKYPMLFRGDFTLRAARRMGYSYGLSTGCPTLFLNELPALGSLLETKYSQLARRINDTSLKIAINVKEGSKFMVFVRDILDRYPNSYVYAQGRGDMIYLEKNNIPFNRVRLFANVEDWRQNLHGMDVSIGARIHGNMLALGASLPVYVIAPDHRVSEMAERMNIPYTTYYSKDVPMQGVDIAKLMSEVNFDGAAFDRNRCEIAKIYRQVFVSYGFEAARHVRQISELC